jgi:hypothetical protein
LPTDSSVITYLTYFKGLSQEKYESAEGAALNSHQP